MTWLITSDWHLRKETAETVFKVLERVDEIVMSEKLDGVIHIGDLYHTRYVLDIEIQNRLVDQLKLWEYPLVIVPGNHDQINLNNGRNALEVLDHVNNVVVRNEPGWGPCEGWEFAIPTLWLPYRKDIAAYAPALQADYTDGYASVGFVHHGLVGAKMNTNVVAGEHDGVPPAWFTGFSTVFFGHWHQHQQVGNCVFVGSPWQTRADEAGQEKGVILWDDTTGEWSFLPVHVGRRFHSFAHGMPADVNLGDQIRVPANVDVEPAVLESFRDAGVEVWEEPKPAASAPRLGLSAGADLREHASAYVKAQAADLDADRLMKTFDFLTGKATS